jgi:hypothetical protein
MTISSALTGYEMVKQFHSVFQHPIKDTPDVSVFVANPKLVNLRYSLIDEETKELIEAYEREDTVEMVDALADINYVVFGAGLAFGINLDTMLKLVQLPKKAGNMKPSEFFSKTPVSRREELLSMFFSLLRELKSEFDSQNMIGIAVLFTRFIQHTYTVAAEMNIDLDEAFDLVHKSNMTKACIDEDQAKASLENYLKDTSLYKQPAIKRSNDGNYWIVYDSSTGKTLKSKFYEPVNLQPLVYMDA